MTIWPERKRSKKNLRGENRSMGAWGEKAKWSDVHPSLLEGSARGGH